MTLLVVICSLLVCFRWLVVRGRLLVAFHLFDFFIFYCYFTLVNKVANAVYFISVHLQFCLVYLLHASDHLLVAFSTIISVRRVDHLLVAIFTLLILSK